MTSKRDLIRIFNTYGPRMRLDDGRALPTFMKQAMAGEAHYRFWRWKPDTFFLLC